VTLRIRIDHELCMSSGRCVGDEPDVFAFDDDQLAYVATAEHQMDRDRVLRIAQNCPSLAIIIHDENGNVIAL
jgi:ferredoxin